MEGVWRISNHNTASPNVSLEVDGLGVGGHGSLLESLGESGVSVARPGNVLAGGTVLDGQCGLGDHLTSTGADDVDTENAVGLGISNEFDDTLGVEVGLGARVGAEGESADVVLDAGGLDLGLVLADPGNLGVGVHDAGDGSVVDMAVALLDVLDNGNSLLLGLVSQHGAEGNVTNDADVGDLGAVLLVNDEAAALILVDADVLNVQTLGVGATADGDQDDISIQGLLLATLGRLDAQGDERTAVVTLGDLGVGLELDALLSQDLLGLLGDLSVHTRTADLAEELNDGDLSTETRPNGGLKKESVLWSSRD